MKYTVIAWTTKEMEWDGEPFAADLGAQPNFVEVVKPKAVVWRKGEKDLEGAESFAENHEYPSKVFVIDDSDPLRVAKERILSDD